MFFGANFFKFYYIVLFGLVIEETEVGDNEMMMFFYNWNVFFFNCIVWIQIIKEVTNFQFILTMKRKGKKIFNGKINFRCQRKCFVEYGISFNNSNSQTQKRKEKRNPKKIFGF